MIKRMWLCWENGWMESTGFLVMTEEEALNWIQSSTDRSCMCMELKWVNNYGKEFPVEQ